MGYSVVVPIKSNDAFLSQALQSIYDQTLPPDEVFAVGDFDDSGFNDRVLDLQSEFPNLRVLKSPKSGMISAINFGIVQASGEFIAFLDSDDLWDRRKQELQIEGLLLDSGLDVVTSDARNFTDGLYDSIEYGWTRAMLFTCATFRASTFKRVGLLDDLATHFTWLYRWWTNANHVGINRLHIQVPGVLRRIHSANSWRVDNERAHQELMNELRNILNRSGEV
jgi:glycosyltransferase involved in cell wall biosynthesis